MHKVLFFAGKVVAVDEQKLGAVKANAFGAIVQGRGNFVRKLDVSEQADPDVVSRDCRLVAVAEQCFDARVLASCLLLIGGDLLGAWVDDDFAAIAVDD